MRCARVRDRFDDLIDGRLREEERRRVEEHLAACPKCVAEYESMARIVQGLRHFPRPEAPALETPFPAGTAPLTPHRSYRPPLRRLRAAAAVLLFVALGFTHFLAFYLGERKNQDLAEIGRRELPRLFSDHLDRTATQLRYAREVAEEEPAALRRLVFDNEVGAKLKATTGRFYRASHHPSLQPFRGSIRTLARDQDVLYATTEPNRLRPILDRLDRQVKALRMKFVRVTVNASRPTPAMDDAEAVTMEAFQRLMEDDPAGTNRILVRHNERRRDTPLVGVMLMLMGEASSQLGEIQNLNTVQNLIRRKPENGLQIFFGPRGAHTGAFVARKRVKWMGNAGSGGPIIEVKMGRGWNLPGIPEDQFLQFMDMVRVFEPSNKRSGK